LASNLLLPDASIKISEISLPDAKALHGTDATEQNSKSQINKP
jgi:hypothetical protein